MTGSETRARARAWAEISQSALGGNIRALRARLGSESKTRLMAVVKADAYGHNMSLVAPICWGAGIADFGVATVDEGIALRSLVPAQAAISIMTATLPADACAIAEHRLTPFVGDMGLARALSEAGLRQNITVHVHLDIDTGIGRAGILASEAAALFGAMQALPCLEITGIATHFADADQDAEDAQQQNALFRQALCELGEPAKHLLVHAGNSPALLALGDTAQYGLVRPGLLLYGIEPAPGMFASSGFGDESEGTLRPVLSVRARVLLCRRLPPGATISYGRTYTVPGSGGVYATLGIGYGDGYPRRLGSGVGHALLGGQAAPICGRVCMDQLVVDVSHISHVHPGDIATLMGAEGGQQITAGQIAFLIKTTPHEVSTCLTSRLPRILTA